MHKNKNNKCQAEVQPVFGLFIYFISAQTNENLCNHGRIHLRAATACLSQAHINQLHAACFHGRVVDIDAVVKPMCVYKHILQDVCGGHIITGILSDESEDLLHTRRDGMPARPW